MRHRFGISLIIIQILDTINSEWIIIPHVEPSSKLITTTENILKNEDLIENMESQNIIKESEEITENSLQNILLRVHRDLIAESDQPLPKRISFLDHLKNSLLHQMWSKCQNIWYESHETARGHHDHYKMGFSSLEGALLTIAFLTFAVFLIKLVKQFIQGLQNNNNNTTVMQMTPAPSKIIKHKRNAEYNDMAAKISDYIEQFQLLHKL